MTTAKILSIVDMYEQRLIAGGIKPLRINPKSTFADIPKKDLLAHAFHLCEGVKSYAATEGKYEKARRHLTAVQMCLSFAGWYTLEDLMRHNMPADAVFDAVNN